jgi:hypothetical protein
VDAAVAGRCGARLILGDEVEAFPHCLVEFGVGFVDDEPYLEGFVASSGRGRGQHAFYSRGEIGKSAHEGDDAFTFFELHFGVFDAADLLVDEAVKETQETVVEGAEGTG